MVGAALALGVLKKHRRIGAEREGGWKRMEAREILALRAELAAHGAVAAAYGSGAAEPIP